MSNVQGSGRAFPSAAPWVLRWSWSSTPKAALWWGCCGRRGISWPTQVPQLPSRGEWNSKGTELVSLRRLRWDARPENKSRERRSTGSQLRQVWGAVSEKWHKLREWAKVSLGSGREFLTEECNPRGPACRDLGSWSTVLAKRQEWCTMQGGHAWGCLSPKAWGLGMSCWHSADRDEIQASLEDGGRRILPTTFFPAASHTLAN